MEEKIFCQSREYKGFFWFPDNPTRIFFGELAYKLGNITLQIYHHVGMLDEPIFPSLDDQLKEVIFGRLYDCGSVVLFEAKCNVLSMLGMSHYTFSIKYALLGNIETYENTGNLVFDEMTFQIPYIEDVLGHTKITKESDKDYIKLSSSRCEEFFPINEDFDLVIWRSYSGNKNSKAAKLESQTFVKLVFHEYHSYDNIVKKYLEKFWFLFSLLTNRNMYPYNIQLYNTNIKDYQINSIEMLHELLGKINPIETVSFKFDLIKDNFSSIIMAYFELTNKLKEAIFSYWPLFLREHVYEYKLEIALRGIESLAKLVIQDFYYIDVAIYKKDVIPKLKSSISDVTSTHLSEELMNRIYGQLDHANELSLNSMFKQLLNNNIHVLHNLFDFNIKGLAYSISELRNSLIHNRTNLALDKEYKKINRLFIIIRCIFEANFFKSIGIPDDAIVEILKNNYDTYIDKKEKGLTKPTIEPKTNK
ncbi:MAG TPA: hypothetical protein PLE74_05790 [Candidatus Cloacimonadota bacterium]|nr:hypothetical protein [Candidatus Cloacimonadota bacterium]